MAEAQDAYRSDDSWNVDDDDGVQYDSSLFVRNEDFLDIHHRHERGFVRLTSAQTEAITHPHDDYRFAPNDGRLWDDDDHYVLKEKPTNSMSQGTVVAAVPVDFVDRPEYAHDHSDGGILAAQRNLRDAYHEIRDARLKMKRAYPEQQGALSAVHCDLATVLRSIEDRRNPPKESEHTAPDRLNERIHNLMESDKRVEKGDTIGADGRFNPTDD